MARTHRWVLGLIALFSAGFVSRAQAPGEGPVVSIRPRVAPEVPRDSGSVPESRLRIDASLVLIPVHATSPSGTNVTDLSQENFRVFEDGMEQNITTFAREDAPLSVGLVFDSSGSMSNKIRKSAEAAAAFFRTANPNDEFFLVEFGDKPKLMTSFTPDSGQIYKKIAHVRPFGRTSLIDAVHLALAQMKNAQNSRKAIVIVSDGGDNRSRRTRSEIKSALVESDVQIYAMGIFDPYDVAKRTREEENGPHLLDELAEQTGGQLYPVANLNDLESVSTSLGNALRSEYVLGYTPSNSSRDGKYRHVKVQLVPSPGLASPTISYRRGYYAPAR